MVINHTHSYVRWHRSKQGEWMYKCANPNCSHLAQASFIKGKVSLCPQCKTAELLLDKEALRRVVPKCPNCRNTKESRVLKKAAELLKTAEIIHAQKLIEEGILEDVITGNDRGVEENNPL